MTLTGWFFLQNWYAYGFILFTYLYVKYGNYMISEGIQVKSYNKGFSSGPIILFVFLNSCFLFNVDASSFFIDHGWTKPYMIEFLFRPWDKFWTTAFFRAMFNSFMGDYDVEECYEYDQGDWGLPFSLKLHQFIICLWWFWLFNKVVLNLIKQYKEFIS